MHIKRETPPSFRIVRGSSGLWEVLEEGIRGVLALFRAPQAALSYACDLAAMRKGSVVVVFDRLPTGEGKIGTTAPGSANVH